QIAPERLLDNDASVGGAAGLRQSRRDDLERARWNRQIMQRPRCGAERLAQSSERLRGVVVAVDVAEPRRQLLEILLDDAPVPFEAGSSAGDELVNRPARSSDPDDRDVELTGADERLERGEDLLVGEIAGRPEEHERVGWSRHQ